MYRHLLDTYALRAEDTVFIDDAPRNIEAAASLGMPALQFTDAARCELRWSISGCWRGEREWSRQSDLN